MTDNDDQRPPQRFRVDGLDFENAEAVKAYLLADDDDDQQQGAGPERLTIEQEATIRRIVARNQSVLAGHTRALLAELDAIRAELNRWREVAADLTERLAADPVELEAILNGMLDLCYSVEQGPLGSVSEWRYLTRDAARNLRDRIAAHQARAQQPPCPGEDLSHAHA